jgi:gliding motility-associated-like protein
MFLYLKHILILLFCLSLQEMQAQAYNYRMHNDVFNEYVSWDINGNVKLGKFNTGSPSFYTSTVICKDNGNLLMYRRGKSIYDSYNNSLIDSVIGHSSSIFIQMNDSIYWFLSGHFSLNSYNYYGLDTNYIKQFVNGLYYSEFVIQKNGIKVNKLNQLLLKYPNTTNSFFKINKIKDYQYLIFNTFQLKDDFFIKKCLIGKLNISGYMMTDSLVVETDEVVIKNSFKNKEFILLPNKQYVQGMSPYGFTLNCDNFFYSSHSSVNDIDSKVGFYGSSIQVIRSFDVNTGKFGSKIDTFHYEEHYSPEVKAGINSENYEFNMEVNNALFSTNDSLIYVRKQNYIRSKYLIGIDTDSIVYVQLGYINFRKNKEFVPLYGVNNTPYNQDLSVNAVNLYLTPINTIYLYELNGTGSNRKLVITEILNPNNPISSLNPQKIIERKDMPHYSNGISYLYSYGRIKKNIIYNDCGAYVEFENKTDESLGLDNYEWQIALNKEHTSWYKYSGKKPPTLFYKQSGYYYYKIHITSTSKTNYSEWYQDSIYISIPPKPIANFYAQDSIVCRYKGLQFNNYSHSQQSTAEEYLWTFGDGNTSTNKNPTHQYTKTGVYTVTLHYKNGYCDSTLTKNQYITVVDAPKPGFTINTTQGCAPLNIMITDTVKRHVSAKDYFISDGSAWVNIPNGQTQLSHTFTQVGKYRAVQRLMGYTGCVTMSDSVWIHVSQGLTLSDTLDVQWSTINTNELIGITGKSKLYNIVPGNALISWQSQAGAVKYQLNKDGSPYAQTTDTFYNDPRLYLQDATYTVQGIDSCGNSSSEGRVGKPVFLKSNLQGNNESVLVQYSPYLDLPKGINSLQYQLEKLVDNNGITQWQPIAQHNQVQTHIDININEQGHLQACYRVAVKANTATISTSNVSCSPFEPVIYIPTAFTPNNDGFNDVYEPMYYGIQSYQLTVYNRWGEQVFVGKDKQAWTGENAAEGVYAVIVEYRLNNSIKKTQTTTVTLLR